jgi:hypothetical protein
MNAPVHPPDQPDVTPRPDPPVQPVATPGTEPITSHRPRQPDRQALWSLAVGVPALVSVLRLWVEAGGDLQTTLLLVSHVGPINLLAAFIVTAAWLVSAAVVLVLALGRLGRQATPPADNQTPWYLWTTRWATRTPTWLAVLAFAFAALTWKILWLPVLALAACAAFDWQPSRRPGRRLRWAAAAAGYTVLFGPPAVTASTAGYLLPAVLIAAPPLLIALGATRPVPGDLATAFARPVHLAATALLLAALAPAMLAPVLPLSSITMSQPDDAAADTPPRVLRGNVIEVSDSTTAVLLEQGGVEFVRTTAIQTQVLCPERAQTPRYRLAIHGVSIEDSLLQAAGRFRRPVQRFDPRCRKSTPEPRPTATPLTRPTPANSPHDLAPPVTRFDAPQARYPGPPL